MLHVLHLWLIWHHGLVVCHGHLTLIDKWRLGHHGGLVVHHLWRWKHGRRLRSGRQLLLLRLWLNVNVKSTALVLILVLAL
jgi:hypothetical protein